MDDKIKYLLMAVGAYFLYDWYTNQAPAVVPVTPDGGGGTGTGTGTDGNTGPGFSTEPGPAPVPPVPVTTLPPWHAPVYTPVAVSQSDAAVLAAMDTETVARAAVLGDPKALAEAERRGLKYNFHQWNWFREQATGQTQPDPSTYFSGDPNAAVGAPQYMLVRATALATGVVQGLSGLGWAPVLPFNTAWRA